MRIVRYPLEIVEYQQLQPLWPGRILAVGPGKDPSRSAGTDFATIDMWCLDNDENRGTRLPPVLGVWIVKTGQPLPEELFEADALFHGTVDLRRLSVQGHCWHVWSAVVGLATEPKATGFGELGSIDEMVAKIKARHRDIRADLSYTQDQGGSDV